MSRPDILFLMSDEHWDEHWADVTGYAGDFRNAYSPSPICIPGRRALMSGLQNAVFVKDIPQGQPLT